MDLNQLKNITDGFSATKKMPLLFIGHGHPMNAILDNDFTRRLKQLGQDIEKPNAILVISAHWETVGTFVSTNPAPHTIYDFGRFDDRLFQVKYEPQGDPKLAREIVQAVKNVSVQEDQQMGLDHGAWTVLKHIFPNADTPVLEMSMDYTKGPSFHFELGKELKKLRERGVLIIASGNIVHNLRLVDWVNKNAKPFEWNLEFDSLVKHKLEEGNFTDLVNYQNLGTAARFSIPTNDHYLPMLYVLGMADKNEPIHQIFEGYEYGAISMRCFQIG